MSAKAAFSKKESSSTEKDFPALTEIVHVCAIEQISKTTHMLLLQTMCGFCMPRKELTVAQCLAPISACSLECLENNKFWCVFPKMCQTKMARTVKKHQQVLIYT